MNQWNCYKRGQITLNEELYFFCIRWNDCCGSRAVRQMTWQMTWCWTISIYSAGPHIRKVSFQQCPRNTSVFQTCLTSVWRLPSNFTMYYIASSDKCLTFHCHISRTLFQPNFYSIYLSIKLIMHKHVQLLILIGKPCFFNDSNGYWNTIDSLVVFKQSNVKWEICRIL